MKLRAAVSVCLVLVGCADGPGSEEANDSAGEAPAAEQYAGLEAMQFADELGVDLERMQRLEEGIYVEDVRAGGGAEASRGQTVVVEYRAWLPDGRLYEQRPNAQGWGPSEFLLGVSAPAPGLSLAIPGMRPGGVRRIVLPPEHGYGLVGRPAGVPANSPLIFEVRLLEIRE